MKRFFQIVGTIFALFALAVLAGAFMPETEEIERVTVIDADVEDVVDYLEDLRNWPNWLTLIPDEADPIFGDPIGNGASLAWQTETSLGSIDLLQVTDELIRASVMTEESTKSLTLALAQDGSGTTVLIRQERALGGFPYFARIQSQIQRGGENSILQDSLTRLRAEFTG